MQSTIQASKASAAMALSRDRLPSLVYTVSVDGKYVVTSPDADWLMITARSQAVARLQAIVALANVSRWCGSDLLLAHFYLPSGPHWFRPQADRP